MVFCRGEGGYLGRVVGFVGKLGVVKEVDKRTSGSGFVGGRVVMEGYAECGLNLLTGALSQAPLDDRVKSILPQCIPCRETPEL